MVIVRTLFAKYSKGDAILCWYFCINRDFEYIRELNEFFFTKEPQIDGVGIFVVVQISLGLRIFSLFLQCQFIGLVPFFRLQLSMHYDNIRFQYGILYVAS